jgi:hypothetical protein
MAKRKLATGYRQGRLLVLMEIEKPAFWGGTDVIVFCFKCKCAKRMRKRSLIAATSFRQDCGCTNKKWVKKAFRIAETTARREEAKKEI